MNVERTHTPLNVSAIPVNVPLRPPKVEQPSTPSSAGILPSPASYGPLNFDDHPHYLPAHPYYSPHFSYGPDTSSIYTSFPWPPFSCVEGSPGSEAPDASQPCWPSSIHNTLPNVVKDVAFDTGNNYGPQHHPPTDTSATRICNASSFVSDMSEPISRDRNIPTTPSLTPPKFNFCSYTTSSENADTSEMFLETVNEQPMHPLTSVFSESDPNLNSSTSTPRAPKKKRRTQKNRDNEARLREKMKHSYSNLATLHSEFKQSGSSQSKLLKRPELLAFANECIASQKETERNYVAEIEQLKETLRVQREAFALERQSWLHNIPHSNCKST